MTTARPQEPFLRRFCHLVPNDLAENRFVYGHNGVPKPVMVGAGVAQIAEGAKPRYEYALAQIKPPRYALPVRGC